MLNIDKVANKAGIELVDGKCPPPKQRGARAWGRLIGWIRKMESIQAEREIETANELAESHKDNAKLAGENRELIRENADLKRLLAVHQVEDRLAAAGIPVSDCKFLASGVKVA